MPGVRARIDAVYEIAKAWPATVREGGDGIMYLSPPTSPPTSRPALRLSDGEDGTVVGVAASVSRDKVYNRVVARGQQSSDEGAPSFQAIADQLTGRCESMAPTEPCQGFSHLR